jgi:phosphate starvation-inducible membrane PsiE
MVTPSKSHALRTVTGVFIYVAMCAVIGLVIAAMEHNLTFENVLARAIFVLVLPVRSGE